MSNNDRDTYGELRGRFDGSDPFMTGGHQIIKQRTGDRRTPDWARSDKNVRAILIRAFPKLKTDGLQRARAARWATVIQLYYRMHLTRSQLAEHLKMSLKNTRRLIERIQAASKGRRRGKGPYSSRPPGRPKKGGATQTSLGSSKIKG